MNKLVVVTSKGDFNLRIDGVEVITAKEYLTGERYVEMRNVRVYNLCRYYRYQSTGYYVSLLAEARGHKVVPSVTTIQDFKSATIIKSISEDIDHLIQRSLSRLTSKEFTLSIYFGRNVAESHDELARAFYNLFEAPLLRAQFVFNRKWQLSNIGAISFKDVPESHLPAVYDLARAYFAGRKFYVTNRWSKPRYNLAILIDDTEQAPPSDKRALRRFVRAAEDTGLVCEFVTKDDLARIGEFDALFIRATTRVNDFTYRFSRRAASEGLVVIDDPLSIMRCTNKVYLAELMARNRIPAPRTIVAHRDNLGTLADSLGLPFVLKQPDSAFSTGVVRVNSSEELSKHCETMLGRSDFVVAQQYMPTEFDWRVGILDRKVLFVCKYYMARGHWQIYNWTAGKSSQAGKWETLAIEDVPPDVVKIALRSANLIGDGFYGVDIKQIGRKLYVIEINDNPSVEAGVEDLVLGDRLYEELVRVFVERIRKAREQELL